MERRSFVSGSLDVCLSTDYYQPSAEVSDTPDQTVLCCGNCSCRDDCWKTNSCCPDKENIIQEPALACISPVVRPSLNKRVSNLGYHIIDYCPSSEANETLVSKCISNNKNDLRNLMWVFDKKHELTYKNEYCARCHHVTQYMEWKLRIRCIQLTSTKAILPVFMFEDTCELRLEIPENTTAILFPVCTITEYNYCNQTGLWDTYDNEIKRACGIYHSPYFVEIPIPVPDSHPMPDSPPMPDPPLMPDSPPMPDPPVLPVIDGEHRIERRFSPSAMRVEIKTYKNVFCYFCNTASVSVAEPVCVLPNEEFGQGEYGLSTLIDYRGFQVDREEGQSSDSLCNKYEVLDKLTGKCRTLICPFGSQPVFGRCELMFQHIINLPVDITYDMRVVWSRSDHFTTDDIQEQNNLGFLINRAVKLDPRISNVGCGRYEDIIYFISNIIANESVNEANARNESLDCRTMDNNRINFVFKTVLLTKESCQLQDIIDQLFKSFPRLLKVHDSNDALEMILTVTLVKEKDYNLDLDKANVIFKLCYKITPTFTEACVSRASYSILTEKQCPHIGVKYSELSPYLEHVNVAIMESMFPGNKTTTDEFVYPCLDDYYN